MNHDNAYAAFMLDYAAGALDPAERLAADLHRALSGTGAGEARFAEAVGGALLEAGYADARRGADAPAGVAASLPDGLPERHTMTREAADDAAGDAAARRRDFDLLTELTATGSLLSLDWRRDMFGMMKANLKTPMAYLLRLEPGEKAPRHSHGRRDVTVVLQGAFSDQYGQYERGDISFAEPGLRHTPEAIGDETCVCLIATEHGRPLSGFLGLFGITRAGARREQDRP